MKSGTYVTIIIAALLICKLFLYWLNKFGKNEQNDFFVSTQVQNNERLNKLGIRNASEDASYILDSSLLSFPKPVHDASDSKDEYKPDPSQDWVIPVNVKDNAVSKKQLSALFDLEWRKNFRSTIYGYSIQEEHWTFADAGDSPEAYTQLQVAVDLIETFTDSAKGYDPLLLERYLNELNRKIKKSSFALAIGKGEPIEKAIERAKELVKLNHEFSFDAVIQLKSENPFPGMAAWDAMECLGLEWGDGDIFHWQNPEDYGDQAFFSVYTTTKPGYFLPEAIGSGEMNPGDLVFAFSVPRSADPEHIFDAMINAVKYCQKRLGGQLFDKYGKPFNEVKEREDMKLLVGKMKQNSLMPGSEKCLRMFD
ncbi:cell division protein ZipA C-terminal FtsZ-binding domain-containing protein [Foetidibacter luteolus]|uniref:cell division protein ZipA C-terminal FtsZ-binding domain-containing protein n=1 Tax=Foetidibacter luteolus TaxID=2608880 RepID=UPI00129B4B99|nr:cell division protein ZipA C-terminal FtsZ-binding domain-containing protein [Foetidibacter luteolus]